MGEKKEGLTVGEGGLYWFELGSGDYIAFAKPTMKVMRQSMQLAPETGNATADNMALQEELFFALFRRRNDRTYTRDELLTAGGLDMFEFADSWEVLGAVGRLVNPSKARAVSGPKGMTRS